MYVRSPKRTTVPIGPIVSPRTGHPILPLIYRKMDASKAEQENKEYQHDDLPPLPPMTWLDDNKKRSKAKENASPPPSTWMAENKCFSLDSSTDDGAARIDAMRSRFNRATDIFLFLLAGTKDPDLLAKIKSKWYERLKVMHSEPTRHYHTLVHLEEMFGYLDLLLGKKADNYQDKSTEAILQNVAIRAMVEAVANMATFFHDAVYDAKSGTNEEDSAALFKEFADELKKVRTGTAHEGIICMLFNLAVEWVVKYIIATKSHAGDDADADDNGSADAYSRSNKDGSLRNLDAYLSRHLSIFLDADMSVLSKDSAAYNAYAGFIRKEYIHVPRAVYCEKRAEILQSFLVGSDGETKTIFATEKMRGWYEQRARQNLREEIATLKAGVIPSENGQVERGATVEQSEEFVADKDESREVTTEGEPQPTVVEATKEPVPIENNGSSGVGQTEVEQKEEVLAPGWETLTDPSSGKEYFYNSQTGETAWKKPSVQHVLSDADVQTGESAEIETKHDPSVTTHQMLEIEASEDAVTTENLSENEAADESQSPEKNDAIEGEFRPVDTDVVETSKEVAVPTENSAPALAPGWVVQYTEDGRPYYYSEIEQRTSWTLPAVESDEKAEDFQNEAEATEGMALGEADEDIVDIVAGDEQDDVNASADAGFESTADAPTGESEIQPDTAGLAVAAEEGGPLPPGWSELYDQASGRHYYCNEITGETMWTGPQHETATVDAEEDEGGQEQGAITAEVVAEIPHTEVESESAALDTAPTELDFPTASEDLAPKQEGELPSQYMQFPNTVQLSFAELPAGWSELADDSGRVYYYNQNDGTTSWDRPPAPIAISANDVAAQEPAAVGEPVVEFNTEPSSEAITASDLVEPTPTDVSGAGLAAFVQPAPTDSLAASVEPGLADASEVALTESTQPSPEDASDACPAELTPAISPAEEEGLPSEAVMPVEEEQQGDADVVQQALPDGWSELADDSGRVYYYNQNDGTTSWDRPPAPIAVAANDVAAQEPAAVGESAVEFNTEPSSEAITASDLVEPTPTDVSGAGLAAFVQPAPTDSLASQIAASVEPGLADASDVALTESTQPSPEDASDACPAELAPAILPAEEEGLPSEAVMPVEEEQQGDADVVQQALPDGWSELADDSGRVYYYNQNDGTTSWDRPPAPIAVAANDVAAQEPAAVGESAVEFNTEPSSEAITASDLVEPTPTDVSGAGLAAFVQPAPTDSLASQIAASVEPGLADASDVALTESTQPSPEDASAACPAELAPAILPAEEEGLPSEAVMPVEEEQQGDADVVQQALPDGWSELADDSGRVYYYNQNDGTTSWDRPPAPIAVAANDVAAQEPAAVGESAVEFNTEPSSEAITASDLVEPTPTDVSGAGLAAFVQPAPTDSLAASVEPGLADASDVALTESTQPSPEDASDACPAELTPAILPAEEEGLLSEAVMPVEEEQQGDADVVQQALPDGWSELADDSGRVYYYNQNDGTTSWDRPPAPIAVAANDVAAQEPAAVGESAVEFNTEPSSEAITASDLVEPTPTDVSGAGLAAFVQPAPTDSLAASVEPGLADASDVALTESTQPSPEDASAACPAELTPAILPAEEEGLLSEAVMPVEEEQQGDADVVQQALPDGWSELADDSGRVYYYNQNDGTTSWDRPPAPIAVAANDVAAQEPAAVGESAVEFNTEPSSEAITASDLVEPTPTDVSGAGLAAFVQPAPTDSLAASVEPGLADASDVALTESTQPSPEDASAACPAELTPAILPAEEEGLLSEAVMPVEEEQQGDADVVQQALPDGWSELADDSGRVYYYNQNDGTTSWDRPPAPIAVAANDVAAQEPAAVGESAVEFNTEPSSEAITASDLVEPTPTDVSGAGLAAFVQPAPTDSLAASVEPGLADASDVALTESTQPSPEDASAACPAELTPAILPAEEEGLLSEAVMPVEEEQQGDADVVQQALPDGWSELADDSGRVYYYNQNDGTTSWDRPPAPIAVAANDVAAQEPAAVGESAVEFNTEPSSEAITASDLVEPTPTDVSGAGLAAFVQPAPTDSLAASVEPGLADASDVALTESTQPSPEDASAACPAELTPAILPAEEEGLLSEAVMPVEEEQQGDADVVQQALPDGWSELADDSGRVYYYNQNDGTTSWDRPPAPIAVAANDVAAQEPAAVGESAVEFNTEPSSEAITASDLVEPTPTDVSGAGLAAFVQPAPTDSLAASVEPGLADASDVALTESTQPSPEDASAACPAELTPAILPAEEEGLLSEAVMPVEEEQQGDADVVQQALPDGWSELADDSGRVYYYNQNDGTTSWDRPPAPIAVAANDVAAQEPAAVGESAVEFNTEPSSEAITASDLVEPTPTDVSGAGLAAFVQPAPTDSLASQIAASVEPGLADASDVALTESTQPSPEDASDACPAELAPAILPAEEEGLPSEAVMPVEEEQQKHADVVQQALPDGWSELADDSGRVYYYNENDGTTSWDRPPAPIAVAANDAAGGGGASAAAAAAAAAAAVEIGIEPVSSEPITGTGLTEAVQTEPAQSDAPDAAPGVFEESAPTDVSTVALSPFAEPAPANTIMPASEEPIQSPEVPMPVQEEQQQPAGVAEPSLQALPEGWEELYDPSSGRPYYYHAGQNTTVWERPG